MKLSNIVPIIGVVVAGTSFLLLWFGVATGFSSSWYGFFTFCFMTAGTFTVPIWFLVDGWYSTKRSRKEYRKLFEKQSNDNVSQESSD